MKTCSDCGMPMLAPEDFAGGDPDSSLCVHCGPRHAQTGSVISFAVFESLPGKADDVFAFLEENLRQTQGFAGVVDALIAQDRENPNRFFAMSKWQNQQAYDAMQLAYAENQPPAPSYAEIRHLLACEPAMNSFTVLK